MSQTIHLLLGDCRERSAELRAERGDGFLGAMVGDPPYEIAFMGRAWDDQGVAFEASTWEEVLKALEPGGILKVFSATRTNHRMILAIEQAGFVGVRIEAWVQGEGFPKGLNISKEFRRLEEEEAAKRWEGYNVALKPSWEPIIVARKPA